MTSCILPLIALSLKCSSFENFFDIPDVSKKKKNPSGITMCAFRKLKGINFTAPSISCHHQIGFFSLQYVTHIDCLDNDLHEPLQEEERGELKVTIKVFLCSKLPPQVIHESVEKGIASGPHPISIFEKVLVTKYY